MRVDEFLAPHSKAVTDCISCVKRVSRGMMGHADLRFMNASATMAAYGLALSSWFQPLWHMILFQATLI